MPFGGTEPVLPPSVFELRFRAVRARRCAAQLPRLRAFAAELDAQADALEKLEPLP